MDDHETMEFICNICGEQNRLATHLFEREAGLCSHCNSTVRNRGVIYLLTKYLLGEPKILRHIPPSKFRGVGLSCSPAYAPCLVEKFEYTNTFFDREPRLDINNPANYRNLDFLISSDVFEHTFPPVIAAFRGAHQILKRGGLLILTVPYTLKEHTLEHYPLCTDYKMVDLEDGESGVELTLQDGSRVLDKHPVWHGGAGNTLEMRVFCRNHLLECFRSSSFEILEEFAYGIPQFGILTNLQENWSLPIAARKRTGLPETLGIKKL